MASKSPMVMRICTRGNNKDKECHLEDSQGRKFKTVLPHSAGRFFIGLTCGYLILFRRKTRDFWLVNPITRHEIHFPRVPSNFVFYGTPKITAVLVNSPSISSTHVLVMLNIAHNEIWFSREGEEGSWNHVSLRVDINYLHVFKGKIYTLCSKAGSFKVRHLCELTLDPKPKLKLLKAKSFPKQTFIFPKLISSGENLYVMESLVVEDLHNVHELDFDTMEWVRFQETTDERAFFLSDFRHGAVVKPYSWADLQSQPEGCNFIKEGHGKFFTTEQWYFPHEC